LPLKGSFGVAEAPTAAKASAVAKLWRDKLAGQAGLTGAVDRVDGVDAVHRRERPRTLKEDGPTAAIRHLDSARLALITQARIAFKYWLSTGKCGEMRIFARL